MTLSKRSLLWLFTAGTFFAFFLFGFADNLKGPTLPALFSIIFPTATAAVSDLQRENVGTALGLFFACGGVGGMAGPWLIGLFSDWLGITAGFGLVLVYCVATLGTLAMLMLMKDEKGVTS